MKIDIKTISLITALSFGLTACSNDVSSEPVVGSSVEATETNTTTETTETTGYKTAVFAPSTALSWTDVTLPTIASSEADIVTVSTNITTDTTWDATKQYSIEGEVRVKSGATLTIPAGTVIYGDAGANFMVVVKGSKIIAEGNATDPITFTSKTALEGGASGQGQWGGLTILGDAPTNQTDPYYEVDETDADYAFGGTTANDNSGSLKYVRILNSGYTVGADTEINGLSLCGVGAGTTVDNIYVADSSDDGIEIWGGDVNLTNIEIVNAGDDSFDLDYGYVGTVTNLTVTQVDTSHAGMEISSGGTSPMTSPTISGFTVTTVDGSDEGGIYLKDDTTAPTFVNGLVIIGGTNGHGAIRAKKLPTVDALNALSFSQMLIDQGVNALVVDAGAEAVETKLP